MRNAALTTSWNKTNENIFCIILFQLMFVLGNKKKFSVNYSFSYL